MFTSLNLTVLKQVVFKKLNNFLLVVFLILVTALVYLPSLKNDFVWDDYYVIVVNSFIKSWKNFSLIFTPNYFTPIQELDSLRIETGSGEVTYRPVVTISYFLDYGVWKLNPFGYHFTSLLLHLANVGLLFLLIQFLLKNRYLAFLSALIFALHPVNTEAVDVISFREDLLVFLFLISSFILFIKKDYSKGIKKNLASVSSVGLFLCALFSKENALVFPMLLFLYDFFFVFKQKCSSLLKQFIRRYLGYFLAVICYLIIILIFRKNMINLIEYLHPQESIYVKFLLMLTAFTTYLFWLLLPFNIRIVPADANLSIYPIFSLISIISLLTLAFVLRKRIKEISFAIFWFFIMLLPVSNIIPLANKIACRYLYLPMVGFSLAIIIILFRLYELKSNFFSKYFIKKLARSALVIILISYAIFTLVRHCVWKNALRLWQEVVEYYPTSALAHFNLGRIFVR